MKEKKILYLFIVFFFPYTMELYVGSLKVRCMLSLASSLLLHIKVTSMKVVIIT